MSLFLSPKPEARPATLESDASLSSSSSSSSSIISRASLSAIIQRGWHMLGVFAEFPLATSIMEAATLIFAMLISLVGVVTAKAWPDFASLWTNNGALFGGRHDEDETRSENTGVGARIIPPKSENSSVLGGLVNYGNTCFLNSVIQSLASVPRMTEMLADSNAYDLNVSTILSALLEKLNTRLSSSHAHSPATLLEALRSPRWTMHTEQQDAHEFLLALLDAIRTERVKHLLKKYQESISISTAVHKLQHPGENQQSTPNNTPVILPFDGLLSTRVSCLTCNEMQSLRQQPFSSIELSLPSASPCSSSSFFLHRFDSTTIESLLENYTAPEILDNVDCQRCSLVAAQAHLERLIVNATATVQQGKSSSEVVQILGAKRDAIEEALSHPTIMDEDFEKLKPPRLVSTRKKRQVAVARPPAALALHINRSEYDMRSGLAKKKNTRVAFPERVRMGKYISSMANDKQMLGSGMDEWYRLASTVIHFGSHSFGHYIAYRRVSDDNWIRASDRDVREATIDEVLAQGNVVLLFYEREDEVPEEVKKKRAEKMNMAEDLMLRLETDVPIFDAHENDFGDGLDLYPESSSSSSAANSLLASPVRQCERNDDDDDDDVASQIDFSAASVTATRRRRCSSSTSTITPVSGIREKQATVIVS
ncbi:uncharacterized protein V1513DRAFT_477969 [Lipomyces chichibuensis]|uniref:uncharacterized protein n=1 Tax=Lipomyces chichibuensis TaxID=1546026 RepID=UPI003343E11D